MKKAITLVAALVAVLAVTSGAFAAKQYLVVSSKQIKNGAVSLSDLSRHAHKAQPRCSAQRRRACFPREASLPGRPDGTSIAFTRE